MSNPNANEQIQIMNAEMRGRRLCQVIHRATGDFLDLIAAGEYNGEVAQAASMLVKPAANGDALHLHLGHTKDERTARTELSRNQVKSAQASFNFAIGAMQELLKQLGGDKGGGDTGEPPPAPTRPPLRMAESAGKS